jgi:ABC-type Fe3+-hydroxamate transport system substrate-binding protein
MGPLPRLPRVRPLLLCVLVVALVASGCGFKGEPTGATVPVAYPVTVVDGAGRQVTVAARPGTVVTTDAGAARLLGQVGVTARRLPAGAALRRIAGAGGGLIVLGPSASTEDADALSQAAHRPVFVMGDAGLVPIEQAVVELGLATGAAARASDVAAGLRARRLAVEHRVRGTRPVRVFVDMGLGLGPPRGSLLERLVTLAGGRVINAGSGAAGPARIRRLHPDAYVATRASGVTLGSLRHTHATASIPAVRDHRVVVVDQRRLVDDDRAYRLLLTLARALRPDLWR